MLLEQQIDSAERQFEIEQLEEREIRREDRALDRTSGCSEFRRPKAYGLFDERTRQGCFLPSSASA
jgi:hypothetical protein